MAFIPLLNIHPAEMSIKCETMLTVKQVWNKCVKSSGSTQAKAEWLQHPMSSPTLSLPSCPSLFGSHKKLPCGGFSGCCRKGLLRCRPGNVTSLVAFISKVAKSNEQGSQILKDPSGTQQEFSVGSCSPHPGSKKEKSKHKNSPIVLFQGKELTSCKLRVIVLAKGLILDRNFAGMRGRGAGQGVLRGPSISSRKIEHGGRWWEIQCEKQAQVPRVRRGEESDQNQRCLQLQRKEAGLQG